ncbi:MAG: hypothetical protein PHP23_13595 [Desulfobacterales bacterium]|nr:hypothetical protein [Desulfobacterales bacterium]MDD4071929.1 hypothetical protein [Desulfobacterales bacterium]MDD4393931.1 hypothetical protein [Desulfobacterales bacterium]
MPTPNNGVGFGDLSLYVKYIFTAKEMTTGMPIRLSPKRRETPIMASIGIPASMIPLTKPEKKPEAIGRICAGSFLIRTIIGYVGMSNINSNGTIAKTAKYMETTATADAIIIKRQNISFPHQLF